MRALVLGWAALVALPAIATSVSADVTVRVLPAQPPKGFETEHLTKAALAGHEIRLWSAQMLEPDCTAHGEMQTDILEAPRHGQARVSNDGFFGNFPQNNVRYHCNTEKSPGKQVFYASADDFHGRDKVVFQNSTSDGRIRKWVVDIDVK